MSDLIGAARILAENAGSVPGLLDPPWPDGGSRARLYTQVEEVLHKCVVNFGSGKYTPYLPSYPGKDSIYFIT